MVPIGGIIVWSGTLLDIPDNYHLCDGNDGTVDLNSRFVYGAGISLAVGIQAGAQSHQNENGATHQCPGGGAIEAWSAGFSASAENLPPFYSLAYIQRMS